MKVVNDNIGNRTRGLPTRNALPLPTAPPRIPIYIYIYIYTKSTTDMYIQGNTLEVQNPKQWNLAAWPRRGLRYRPALFFLPTSSHFV
jgi:hypothetical protein